MYILCCIGFILVAIFEIIVAKCLKDIYERLDLIERIIYFPDFYPDLGDSYE